MSDLFTADELIARLQDAADQVERRAADDSHFDKYAVLGMHADLRPYLENWGAYSIEQRMLIAEAVNYVSNRHDSFMDAGADGYDDDRTLVAALPRKLKALEDAERQ